VEVDATWRAGKVLKVTLRSSQSGSFNVRLQGAVDAQAIRLVAGQPYELPRSR
jgi:hypothetical protein